MADAIYGRAMAGRNGFQTDKLGLTRHRHPALVEHELITPEVQVALLDAVDQSGDASLGDLAEVICDHPRPISAILALVDARVLGIDLTAPFDASCRVWRIDTTRI